MCWDCDKFGVFICYKKVIVIALYLVVTACAGGGERAISSRDTASLPRGQNSYYYYFLSQLKDSPQSQDLSEAYLNEALKENKESGFLWSQKALKEAQGANWDVAMKDALMALAKNPRDAETLLLLGKLHAAKQNLPEALSYYHKVLAIDPQKEEAYNVMAREYLSLNDEANAFKILKTCERELPDAMSCLFYEATLSLKIQDFNGALKAFQSLLELDPENVRILQTLGDIYLQKKNYEKALEIFNQLKQANPNDLPSQIRVGLLYYELKEIDKAIEEFLSVQQRFPKSDRMNYFLGLLYLEKKQMDLAQNYLSLVDMDSSLYGEALRRRIFIYKEQGRFRDAFLLLDKLPDQVQRTPEMYSLRASLHAVSRDDQKAVEVLDEGLSRFATDENLRFQRAVILDRLGDWEQAKLDLRLIIQANPKSDRALNYLGYTMADRGDNLADALKFVEQASDLNPADGHITDSVGWVYFKMGKIDKAINILNKALRQESDEPTILEHLGDVFLAIKNKKLSRQYYERSLNILQKIPVRMPDEDKQIQSIKDKLATF